MNRVTKPKVLIMAGGTGGHIFPAMSVAAVLDSEIHWLGTVLGMETKLLQGRWPLHYIKVKGLRGQSWRKFLMAPWVLSKACFDAYRLIKAHKFDLVMGFGGYVSGPGGLAAYLCRVPLVIQEQNAIAGTSNRILAYLAKLVFCAYPNAFQAKIKVQCLGNPLRQSLLEAPSKSHFYTGQQPCKILVIGGSHGAKQLNEVLPRARALTNLNLEIWHQTGASAKAEVRAAYGEQANVKVTSFIEDMSAAYLWADLVIARAGAISLAEFQQMGLPAILVPYPFCHDNHQVRNAEAQVALGAAELILSQDLKPDILVEILRGLIANPLRLKTMSLAAKAAAKSNALTQIIENLKEILDAKS